MVLDFAREAIEGAGKYGINFDELKAGKAVIDVSNYPKICCIKIDIIIDYDELSRLKKKFTVAKNDRLKKYEIKMDGIDIDIYLPFYSALGLPAEEIKEYTRARGGFTVPRIEALLALKQTAYAGRQGTPKGEKDKIDIFSLLALREIDWNFYHKLTENAGLKHLPAELKSLLKQTVEVKELNLNQTKIAKLKKEILVHL